MSNNAQHEFLLERLLAVHRNTAWNLESLTHLDGDIGHPQGLTLHDGHWLVTTVHPSSKRGSLSTFDRSGQHVGELDVTDGERIHPGGIDGPRANDGLWIAVAEYRPHSTSCVIRVDDRRRITDRFDVNDHLGAVCDLGDGTLLAVSWGSRDIYRFSHEGDILDKRPNPSHMVDYQDLQVVSDRFVLASGVASYSFGGAMHHMGGFAIIDTADHRIVHEVPITATMRSGRSITYNGFHVETRGDDIVIHSLVDDTRAAIGHWTAS